jgi:hypothetical protein
VSAVDPWAPCPRCGSENVEGLRKEPWEMSLCCRDCAKWFRLWRDESGRWLIMVDGRLIGLAEQGRQ